jgi:hypothetical protein
MEFSDMVGRVLESVEETGERIVFNFNDGTACESYHSHDCCESVSVQETLGNIDDIIGSPILESVEDCESRGLPEPEYPDSWTWTRQRIRTAKGEVTFVWLGVSNGYYGETPYFQITHGKKV